MTDADRHGHDDSARSEEEYDPFEHVPERISPITASGLAWLDGQLTEENKARLRPLPVERQASVLADLLEAGAVGVRSDAVRDLLDSGAICVSNEDSDYEGADR